MSNQRHQENKSKIKLRNALQEAYKLFYQDGGAYEGTIRGWVDSNKLSYPYYTAKHLNLFKVFSEDVNSDGKRIIFWGHSHSPGKIVDELYEAIHSDQEAAKHRSNGTDKVGIDNYAEGYGRRLLEYREKLKLTFRDFEKELDKINKEVEALNLRAEEVQRATNEIVIALKVLNYEIND